MYNNGCCTPPLPKRDDCCCKDGIICALDWFFQDFLSTSHIIKNQTLIYYPNLVDVSNIIYNIPYISPDIVPIYISQPTGGPTDPYCGDITYLNICEIEGFQFELADGVIKSSIESDITTRFSKIKYVSPNNCCCKNGLMEYLLKARDFLTNPCLCNGATTNVSVTLSTSDNSFNVTKILAVNSDTVWAKQDIPDAVSPTQTIYYVISLCELKGITLNRTNVTALAHTIPSPISTFEEEPQTESVEVAEATIASKEKLNEDIR